MSTEFSLEGFTNFCNLKWSAVRSARNGKRYRKAAMTPEFQTIWPEQRDYLRQHGVSVYIEYGQNAVFDWTPKGGRATEEEYNKQEERRTAECIEAVKEELKAYAAHDRPDDYAEVQERIDALKTLEELEVFADEELTFGKSRMKEAQHEYSLK